MAAVVVTVRNDGAARVERRPIQPLKTGESGRKLLEAKAASHVQHGWKVEWTSPTSFHASKIYPENYGNPDEPSRKDRYFSLKD